MCSVSSVFFFNDTATTEIYTLSLHDALPIWGHPGRRVEPGHQRGQVRVLHAALPGGPVRGEHARHRQQHRRRSEEHTSELQSRQYLVCRLLLEKKKTASPY